MGPAAMKLCLLLSFAVGAFCASIKGTQNVPGDTIQSQDHSSRVRQRRSTNDACDSTHSAMTQQENDNAVKFHNKYRSKEKAANELTLSFDKALADRAQQWADKCLWDHGMATDCKDNALGQNMYMKGGGASYPTLNVAEYIESWYSEKKYYNVATKLCAPGKMCGHYKQVAWAPTGQVGCGYKKCPSVNVKGSPKPWTNVIIFVCDYNPPGNYKGKSVNTPGVPCSLCTKVVKNGYRCENNLCFPCVPKIHGSSCTCEEKECKQGTWSKDDCACKCNEGYTGVQCDRKSGCSDAHPTTCPGWKSYCGNAAYKQFMTTTCPKTCKDLGFNGFC